MIFDIIEVKNFKTSYMMELFTEIKKKQFQYTCLLIKKLLLHVKNRKKI